MQACTSIRSCSVRPPRPPQARQVEPDQFRAAAANVEHQRPVAIAVDQRGAAGDGELRLGLLRHDLDPESGLALDRVDELAAIGGDAAGLRGDQPRPRHPAPLHFFGADLECFQRAVHRRRRQLARAQHAFAETDDAGERIDDEKAAARGLGDQQPAVIGAKIERGIDRWRLRPRRARVVFALGCRREAMGRRVCTRPGCDLRWATSPAVAGLVSLSLAVSRNHGSRARIAARPIHGVQPLTPGTADASSACRASGALVLCRSIYQSLERGKAAFQERPGCALLWLERRGQAMDSRSVRCVDARRRMRP